ncbi:interferon-induced helicase C domain-containing protein 1-like isoform X2 [Ruditapes philippinarum]|uniref:interferon-induced helicase C domain-containing protein 1-like isoform X2 n=1 Tax=Ruditapes philippinarum TaxID=129788 RepID=UPI00295AD78B|nr:interferon-induced helicase C domain-containing protein 1-like isoform X2 [Ruditapes philippinarum]
MATQGQKRSYPNETESGESDLDEDALLAEDENDDDLADVFQKASLSDEEEDDDESIVKTGNVPVERGLNLREYQKELAETAILGQNTIIHAATGAGKTRIAFYIVKNHLDKNPQGRVALMADKTFLVNQHFAALNKVMPEYKEKTLCMSGQKEKSGQLHMLVEGHSIIILTPALIENTIRRHDANFMSKFTLLIFDECHHTQKKTNYNRLMTRYHVLKSQGKTPLPQILGLTATLGTNKANSVEKAKEHALTVMANLDVSKISTVVKNQEEYNKFRKDVVIDKIVLSDDAGHDKVHCCITECMRKTTDILCSNTDTTKYSGDVDYENLKAALRKRDLVNTNDQQYLTWIAELSNAADLLMGRERDLAHSVRIGANYLKIYWEALNINDQLTGQYAVTSLDRKFKNENLGKYASSKSSSEIEYSVLAEGLMSDMSNMSTDQSLEGKSINKLLKKLQEYCNEMKENARYIVFVGTREISEMLADLLKTKHFKCSCFTGSSAASEVGGTSRNEQEKIVEDFKKGMINGIIATTILEEGFDIPDCDMVFGYNYVGNEISMRQSAGRIRKKEGQHVVLSKQKDMIRGSINVQRGRLMDEALNSIVSMSEKDIKDIITTEQRRIVQTELAKQQNVAKVPKLDTSLYKLICKKCGKFEVNCNDLRSIQDQHHVVIQPDIWTKVRVRSFPRNPPRFAEEIICEGRLFGGGGNDGCPHEIGVVGTFRGARLPFLSYKFLLIKDKTSLTTRPITKWADVPFKIHPINDPEDLTTMQNCKQ